MTDPRPVGLLLAYLDEHCDLVKAPPTPPAALLGLEHRLRGKALDEQLAIITEALGQLCPGLTPPTLGQVAPGAALEAGRRRATTTPPIALTD